VSPNPLPANGPGSEKDRFYDAEIGPMMVALVEKCERAGIPFFAYFELGENYAALTVQGVEHPVLRAVAERHLVETLLRGLDAGVSDA
jgi:hypothetical protein